MDKKKMDKKVCPFCVEENKKSQIIPQVIHKTQVHCEPYYDEEGDYHFHDSNEVRQSFICSNGHMWQEVYKVTPCPNLDCDWGNEDPIITTHLESC